MGNNFSYPFGNNNQNNNNPSSFSRQNKNNRITNSNYNTNITKNTLNNSISPNSNKKKEIEYNKYNNGRKNTYFFGYHQKSNKSMKQLPQKNINQNQNSDNNNIISNFKNSFFFYSAK